MGSEDVASFFDHVADEYHSVRSGMQHYHAVSARMIEAGLSGSVLSVGGLWSHAQVEGRGLRLTVIDAAARMLDQIDSAHARIRGTAVSLPFARGAFDHVVFPLVLHHITGDSAARARSCVQAALREARAVLRPGGRVWISEFCVNRAVYAVERASSPVTRRLLAMVGAPLVVMHSRQFYREALELAGFQEVEAVHLEAPSARPTDLIRPVIGLPSFRIPRFAYPVKPTLIWARASSASYTDSPAGDRAAANAKGRDS